MRKNYLAVILFYCFITEITGFVSKSENTIAGRILFDLDSQAEQCFYESFEINMKLEVFLEVRAQLDYFLFILGLIFIFIFTKNNCWAHHYEPNHQPPQPQLQGFDSTEKLWRLRFLREDADSNIRVYESHMNIHHSEIIDSTEVLGWCVKNVKWGQSTRVSMVLIAFHEAEKLNILLNNSTFTSGQIMQSSMDFIDHELTRGLLELQAIVQQDSADERLLLADIHFVDRQTSLLIVGLVLIAIVQVTRLKALFKHTNGHNQRTQTRESA